MFPIKFEIIKPYNKNEGKSLQSPNNDRPNFTQYKSQIPKIKHIMISSVPFRIFLVFFIEIILNNALET